MLNSKKEYKPQKEYVKEAYEPGYIKEVLKDLGFNNIADTGTYFRAKAIYRKGDALSFSIHKTLGTWLDYKTGQFGTLKQLPGLFGPRGSEIGIKSGDITPRKPNIPKPVKYWEPSVIKNLLPVFDFYKKRGITEKTLKLFKAGYTNKTDLKNRIVFPIFHVNNKIIGFSGRDVTGKSPIKWKHISQSSRFIYPVYTIKECLDKIQETKIIYLVESIGDCLSLWQNGLQNAIVLFGKSISQSVINFLISQNLERIYISLNNEKSQEGNVACVKVLVKLSSFFDISKLHIYWTLLDKDFGDFRGDDFEIWKNMEVDTKQILMDYLKKKQYLLPPEKRLLDKIQ